jgi:hypothetical protein
MANQWLRLWHDMPTDPKWKTIARVSGQPISLVQAVYLHLLVDASRNVTRGHVTVTQEDLASALDVTDAEIEAVLNAMQGRVMHENRLSGWDKRQVKKEECAEGETSAKTAAQRKREQRERERESQAVTQCHDESRNVTLDKDKEEDTDKRKDGGDAATPPAGERKKKTKLPAGTLSDYLASRKAQSLPVFDNEDLFERYADKLGMPMDYVYLAWQRFQFEHTEGNRRTTAQSSWSLTFLNCLRNNWYKLWWHDGSGWSLTTAGKQAQLEQQERVAA